MTTTLTAITSVKKKRDGNVEAIVAFARARTAAKEIKEATEIVASAMAAIADGMAVEASGKASQSWRELLASPIKELWLPSAFVAGREAQWLGDDGLSDGSIDLTVELDDLEQKIRAAIDDCGPTHGYKQKLDALWHEGVDLDG